MVNFVIIVLTKNNIYKSKWQAANPSVLDIDYSDAEVTFVKCTKEHKRMNHLNPVMLVFIGKLSPSTIG